MDNIETTRIAYRAFPALFSMRWPKLINVTISGPAHDHIFDAVRSAETFYESGLLEEVAIRLPRADGVAFDVGANIGNHTLFFSLVLGLRVVSIEPQALAVKFLERNLQDNNVSDRVELVRAGAADRSGSAVITTDIKTPDLGYAQIKLDVGKHSSLAPHAERVSVTTVDILASARLVDSPVRLIKIDVEGMEPSVLRGGITTIAKHRPLLVIEAHDSERLAEIDEICRPLQYERVGPFGWSPTYIYCCPEHRRSELIMFFWRILRTLRRKVFGWRDVAA